MKDNERKFKGVWITAKLWLDKGVTWLEKCVIAEIDSLSNEEKPCTASDDYLAEMFSVSRGRMANILSDLRKAGYIETTSFDGRRRGLRVKAAFTESVNEPSRIPLNQPSRIPTEQNDESCSEQVGDVEVAKGENSLDTSRDTREVLDKTISPAVKTNVAIYEIVESFGKAYMSTFHAPYVATPVEYRFAKDLLKRGVTKEQVADLALRAWRRGGFWSKQATSLRRLASSWNEILAEVSDARPPKSEECLRLEQEMSDQP